VTIVWRDKLLAFGIHFILTALVAAAAAALIFLVWFPAPFGAMIGGAKLFMLVVGCDLALGPLLSLVIFNRTKSRRELVTDYTVVAVLQLAALSYGVWVMAASRPVYVAFSMDRYEVVMAQAISDADLAAARDPRYARRPLLGPEFVAIHVPDSEQQEVLMEEISGHETHARPRFYVPYSSALEEIRKRGGRIAELEQRHPEYRPAIERAVAASEVPLERLRWLPVAARLGFWTALVDVETGKPVAYAPVDPY
jgi:hypothetical protein